MTDAPVGSGLSFSPCDRCRTSIPQTMLVHRKIRRGTDGYRQHGQESLCPGCAGQQRSSGHAAAVVGLAILGLAALVLVVLGFPVARI
jgi:hypothetical protein